MNRILAGILVAGSLTAPATAADLAPKGTEFFQPAANWTGFYLGINGGGGVLNGDILDPECWTCASTTLHSGFRNVWRTSRLQLAA